MFKRTVIAASLVAATLASAQSMAAIVGGGATLPENLYNGSTAIPARLLPTDFTYVGVGSGGGKSAFLTNAGADIKQAGQNVDFAGSDSVLSASEISTYAANKQPAWGKLIQIPSVGTSVAVPYKLTGVSNLQLTGQDMCNIFNGTATKWDDVLHNGSQTDIKVVYRSVNSGTTELLSRFLADSCSNTFGVSNNFGTARKAGGTLPASFIPAAESADVVSAVYATEGAIGYVGPDYVTTTDNSKVARVSKAAVAAGTAPLPTAANARTALASAAAPTTAADRADPSKWVPIFNSGGVVPASGYPIVGYTNLLVGQCYQTAADATAVRSFLNDLYSGNKATVIAQHFFVSVPTTFAAEIKKAFLDNSYNEGTDIGNAGVCNGIGRS